MSSRSDLRRQPLCAVLKRESVKSACKELCMNFQDVITNLQRFWAAQGCVLQFPYDMEVGAGTFNLQG